MCLPPPFLGSVSPQLHSYSPSMQGNTDQRPSGSIAHICKSVNFFACNDDILFGYFYVCLANWAKWSCLDAIIFEGKNHKKRKRCESNSEGPTAYQKEFLHFSNERFTPFGPCEEPSFHASSLSSINPAMPLLSPGTLMDVYWISIHHWHPDPASC